MCPKHDHCEKCDEICDDSSYTCFLCSNHYCIQCAKYKDKDYIICDLCMERLNNLDWIIPINSINDKL